MANPQWEDGYMKIALEIQDALCRIRIPGEAGQVLNFILRKTYGWNKKDDFISLSQFVLGTGLHKDHICQSIKKLILMNLIVAEKGNEGINKYRFNKDFDSWKPLPKKETLPKKEMVVAEKGNEPLPKKAHTIDTITKDILPVPLKEKRNREQVVPKNPNIKLFIDYFYDSFLKKTERRYCVQGAKDGKLIKKLLGTYTLDELKDLCNKFFDSTDEFILKAGYSIGVFHSQIPKLLMPKKHSLSGIGSMDELKKWSEHHNVEFGGKNE